MNVVGYDPGMTIANALKLPNTTTLVDNMKAVFQHSDYISINIPYINKPVSEGGTHGIIGRNLLMTMRPGACLLNFARGELINSEDLKGLFDAGHTGKYVTDFPDDLLWDHPNAVVLPHLGASTEEAEDAAASMAAETIKQFLETGAIRNSVNFPETKLDVRSDTTVRIALVNENKSGVLANVLTQIADARLNILQQVNRSKGNIAYNVIDVELDDLATGDGQFKTWSALQEQLTMIEGVISSRFMNDIYGTGYAKKVAGNYYV
jgi:D-3-phosphoglycerate dehydrogenase